MDIKPAQDYQKRVCKEEFELSEKINKLHTFLTRDDLATTCSRSEYFLLRLQLSAMCQYRDILQERIESFK